MPLQFDSVIFDAQSRRVWCDGTEVHLSLKAFELLALLVERRPQAVSKQEIHDRLWPGTFVSGSSLPSLVSEIRTALADHRRKPHLLRTVHGFGYAFQPPTKPPAADAGPAAAGPRAWLVGDAVEIALAAGENVLGRDGADVIEVKSSTVSRRHARIVIDENGIVVEDLASKNGTYVNDRRVAAPTPIVDGDQIRVGSLLFTFRTPLPGGSTETVRSSSPRLRS
jgi:DNA-binding winged helix-turn-helix (wHTH) protein